jgi:hypothetical protein
MYRQYNTKNQSFLDLYIQLRDEGLLNPFYMTLYDMDLLDVDPHDPNLTTIQKSKILLECARNPWYFFREVLMVYDMGEPLPIKHFPINKGTLAILFCAFNGIDHIVRLPRQHYRENTYKYLLTYLFLFGANRSKVSVSGINNNYDHEFVNFVGSTMLGLPSYFHTVTECINGVTLKNLRLTTSMSEIELPELQYVADYIARGLSSNIQYYHLADHNEFIRTLVYGSMPGFSRSKESDEYNGSDKLYCRMISSFINEDSEADSACFVESLINQSSKWQTIMFDMGMQEVRNHIYKNASNNFMYIEYDFFQLGKDKEWFDQQSRMLNNDQGKINRELLLSGGISTKWEK